MGFSTATTERGRPGLGPADVAIAAALFVGTVLYWTSLPHTLGPADESVHLYEAKRVLDGEVLYRDVFNFIPPGWFYGMAALFWAFGASIETARAAMAIVHGLTAVCVYVAARRLAVRTSLAAVAGLGYLMLCQSAWPIVSQHWVSTLSCVALVMICAGRHPGETGWAWRAGLALGLLLGVQHHRGAFMAAGVALWLSGDALLRRRYRVASPFGRVAAETVALGAGAAVVFVPLIAIAAARAGIGAVWYALVDFPLFNYRAEIDFPWGDVNVMTAGNARLTVALALKYGPVVLVPTAARLIIESARARDHATTERLWLLLAFNAASILSIWYSPDFIHIAFVAFAFLLAAVENLDWALTAVAGRTRAAALAGWAAAAVMLALTTHKLHGNRALLRQAFPYSHQTAFGRVEYPQAEETRLRDELAALLDREPSRVFYAYPILADLYLTVPADNPTPYGFFLAGGYHRPEEVQRVIDVLEARRPPYVVLLPGLVKPDDAVGRYLLGAYEPLSTPLAGRVIYRRRTM